MSKRTLEERLNRLSKFSDFALKKSGTLFWNAQLVPVPGASYITASGMSAEEAMTKLEAELDKLAARFAER